MKRDGRLQETAEKGLTMKTIIGAGMMMALLIAGTLLAQEPGVPRIEVKEMRHDFGKVVQGEQVSHVFEIRSAGSGTLVIERVQTS